jgi:hypothetical protein
MPPSFADLFSFAFSGDIAFKIATVGTNIVVQSSDGKDVDGNGITSEWTIFQWDLITTID